MSAVFAPLSVSNVLVATVVPWTIVSILWMNSSSSMESFSASSFIPVMNPIDESSGVESVLCITASPESETRKKSVNVPPISTPSLYFISETRQLLLHQLPLYKSPTSLMRKLRFYFRTIFHKVFQSDFHIIRFHTFSKLPSFKF